MSEFHITLIIAVFAGVILLIAFDLIDMALAALLGVCVLLALGALNTDDLLAAAVTAGGPVALLFGGMVVAGMLARTGVFDWVGERFLSLTAESPGAADGGHHRRHPGAPGRLCRAHRTGGCGAARCRLEDAHVAAALIMTKGYLVAAQAVPEVGLAAGFTDWPAATLPVFVAMMFGATLGGNATLIGASANIVAGGICNAAGERLSFMRFARIGLPITLVQLTLGARYVLGLTLWPGRG